MAKPVHAVDYLAAPQKHAPCPVCAVFGDEAFLKRQVLAQLRHDVLGGGEGDFSLARFEGRSALLCDVMEELATVAMFGSDKRLVLVEEADKSVKRHRQDPGRGQGDPNRKDEEADDEKAGDFVSRYRKELEKYVAKPCAAGVLVLEVQSWPANTRLAKAVAADGLAVDCRALPTAKLGRWLTAWARQAHDIQLTPAAADTLIEMVGPELGLLDQELAKLALVAGPGAKITPQQAGQLVGTWRAKTTWQMLDAVLDGHVRQALVELDRLLLAGEQPVAILARIAFSLRRFAGATRVVLAAEAAGRRVGPRQALQQVGVKPFLLESAERQLRRLGRHRGARLYKWLLKADLDLKGGSPLPPRLLLEQLIVRLAADSRQPGAAGGYTRHGH